MSAYEEKKKLFDDDFNKVDILDTEPVEKSKEDILIEFKNAPIEIYKKSNKLWTLQDEVRSIENKLKTLKLNMKKVVAMEKTSEGKCFYSSDAKINDEVSRRIIASKENKKMIDTISYLKMEIQSYQTKIEYLDRIFTMYNTLLKVGGLN